MPKSGPDLLERNAADGEVAAPRAAQVVQPDVGEPARFAKFDPAFFHVLDVPALAARRKNKSLRLGNLPAAALQDLEGGGRKVHLVSFSRFGHGNMPFFQLEGNILPAHRVHVSFSRS